MQGNEQVWLQQQVCAPLKLRLTDDQAQRLSGFVDLLLQWNTTYNLTAVRDRAGMLTQHLADCLAVVPELQRHLQQHFTLVPAAAHSPACLLDVGSGGGLPGAVLSILLPQLQVTTVDTVGKKAAFVRQVAGALALANLHPVHGRVENMQGQLFNVITSRAFASLPDFVKLTRPRLAPGGVWMAMKGKQPQDEMDALPADVDVFHVEQLAVPGLDAERCLIWMRARALATGDPQR